MIFITIERSEKFKTEYKKLPLVIKKKFEKQLRFLQSNLRHPSLRAKKVSGLRDIWEARIDRSYRFSFTIDGNALRLIIIGPHDEGLGKK